MRGPVAPFELIWATEVCKDETFWFVENNCEPFTASLLTADSAPAVRFVIFVPAVPCKLIRSFADVSYRTDSPVGAAPSNCAPSICVPSKVRLLIPSVIATPSTLSSDCAASCSAASTTEVWSSCTTPLSAIVLPDDNRANVALKAIEADASFAPKLFLVDLPRAFSCSVLATATQQPVEASYSDL